MRKRTTRFSAILAVLFLFAGNLALAQAPYVNEIPVPPLYDGSNGNLVTLVIKPSVHNFDPSGTIDTAFTKVNTWCYDSIGKSNISFLGPTLQWWNNEQTNIWMIDSLFPDTMTTTHWHGLELPAVMDGGPHDSVQYGVVSQISFLTLDEPATAWYHPHLHNNTFGQVEKGLSGMIIIADTDDQVGPALPHTYGADDFPIVIQDRDFKLDTTTGYYMIVSDKVGGRKHKTNIVNGVVNPYLEVPAHQVRLRILNGSSRKGMRLALAADETTSNFIPITLIATDGGYTLAPTQFDSMTTGVGERIEIVLNLEGYQPGQVLYLRNLTRSLPTFIVGAAPKDPTFGESFLQLRIVADSQFPNYVPVTSPPSFTTQWDPTLLDTNNIDFNRTKRLVGINNGTGFTIDGSAYDIDLVNDYVCEGAHEIWTIVNNSPIAHPFHIHKVAFRVLNIRDGGGKLLNLDSLGLNGPKDDVFLMPGWSLRFLAVFDDYGTDTSSVNSYMYHCHILTHEDSEGGGMMHQFVVTNSTYCPIVGQPKAVLPRDMVVYPNPTNGALFLKGDCAKPSSIRIFDLLGRPLRFQALKSFSGSTPLNVDGLPRGLVLVEWNSGDGIFTRKVMLE
jgi:FtsP/CotA-like multicopper oxidase with cupredoxin domain